LSVVRRVVSLILVAGVLGGCGAPGADLFVAERSGSIPGAALRMRVIDDGQVVCNGKTHDLDSKDLIKARVMVHDISKQAQADTILPPGHPTILRFRIRDQDGTVEFSDTSPRQPKSFYEAAQLIRTIARNACHLSR
jgi:hypothetical protein